MAARKIEFFNLKEDPDLWERLIEAENDASSKDPAAGQVVESMYWERDREVAFERYFRSLDFQQIADLLGVFRIPKKHPLCEIGGGSGQLAWSLAKAGFQSVELLEPNPRLITGTEWLRGQVASFEGRLTICNSLGDWYGSEQQYHTIVTRNCVHHFPNIPMVAAAIRQKVKKGGTWVMIREWFADSPEEMRRQMLNHPYCQKYGVYEFPFPASHYISSVEYAGFRLRAVVPLGWGNNALSSYTEEPGSSWNRTWSKVWRWCFKKMPGLTVARYRWEQWCNSALGTGFKKFTRPQMMVFQRVED
jgi:hypothetical protein